MFYPLEHRESMLIFRGLIILIIAITLGVSVSQQQLSSLTHRQESIGIFNLEYAQNGNYSIYILGANYNLQAVYSVGQIIVEDKAVTLKIMNQSIKVPTYMEFDYKQELIILDLWVKTFMTEVSEFAQEMSLELRRLK